MKKIILLFALTLIVSVGFSQKVKLTVNFAFSNIVEGYDHNCKTEVYIDGQLLGTSPTVLESVGGSIAVRFDPGEHEIKVINYAQYEGQWEVHTIENQYGIDALLVETRKFKKGKTKLNLDFDIDSGTIAVWK